MAWGLQTARTAHLTGIEGSSQRPEQAASERRLHALRRRRAGRRRDHVAEVLHHEAGIVSERQQEGGVQIQRPRQRRRHSCPIRLRRTLQGSANLKRSPRQDRRRLAAAPCDCYGSGDRHATTLPVLRSGDWAQTPQPVQSDAAASKRGPHHKPCKRAAGASRGRVGPGRLRSHTNFVRARRETRTRLMSAASDASDIFGCCADLR